MPIRNPLLALSLPAALWTFAPAAEAANTNPRPTYIRPPPSARWAPKEYVDPCTWHWDFVRWPCGAGGGGGGGGEGGRGGRNRPRERFGYDDGAPVAEAPMQKYTDEGLRKLEEKAARDDGKPEWTEYTGELVIESREDVKFKKAGDYLAQTNALQETRDAVNKKRAELKDANRGGGTLAAPQPVKVPVERSEPAGASPSFGTGEGYVIVPREE